jgi:hypothetical protein
MSENIHLKEYGSSIQKMVNYLLTIDDREKRTRQAYVMVELMRQLHPNMKDGQDYGNKLWDDLYRNLRDKHFGQNVNLLVRRAVDTDDAEERRGFVSYLVRLMKGFYTTWNKENVEDETIYQSLLDISKGMLAPDIALIRSEGLVEANPREAEDEQSQRIGRSGRLPNNNFPVVKEGRGISRQERRERYRQQAKNNNSGGNNSNSNNNRNFRGGNNSGNNRRRR